MEVKVVTISVKTDNEVEQAKMLVSIYAILHKLKLSETQKYVLAYFMLMGYTDSTKKFIIKSGILKNDNTLNNCLSQLRKAGLIRKIGFREDVHPNLVKPTPATIMKIRLDNR